MAGKVMTMAEAIGTFVADGDILVIEGFTHLISFAAGHEIIRQKKRDLVACRLTPDLIYDQMVAAGCVRKLVFSWAGNPGVGSLFGLRRAVEQGIPRKVEIEEYSHFGMVARFTAGASGLPFMHLKDYEGCDLPKKNRNIKFIKCPYTGGRYATVPALNPDVAVIQVQRADEEGNGPDLGPDGSAEGGGLRLEKGDRRRRGAGPDGGRPGRPEPDADPGPHRGRGRGGALRGPSELCFGLLRPGQRLLRAVGEGFKG
jgi:glutaconate CoA-transferase subunit A